MRDTLGDFFLHLGWALMGQGCDCGHNPFNRLAGFMDKRVNRPELWDDLEPKPWWLKGLAFVSERLMALGNRLLV